MSKPSPSLIADVRSILRRSLPQTEPQHFAEISGAPEHAWGDREILFPSRSDSTVFDEARDMMHSLDAATALGRLFPRSSLVLVTRAPRPEPQAEPLAMRSFMTRRLPSGDLAAIIRTAMVEEFPASVPATAEALLAELGAIERQDRGYYSADEHNEDTLAAYNYRQRRRSDILTELLELKRNARSSY